METPRKQSPVVILWRCSARATRSPSSHNPRAYAQSTPHHPQITTKSSESSHLGWRYIHAAMLSVRSSA